ncbi:gamma-aminobutyric acid type B receptor subunit 1-like [Daphnia pulex]|uniref:gamma-aminobutyric acid type B receptor subunit 1-like n=1 Tax=Daphnia pulex TaxID=6669 RepID=UPI001EDE8C90|nr:gamma-aminobutyric acid type B receptor subunit 1-like [Daphnia pulex]XP_046649544.1 gamma-aminobutyric acid type B receptor subunit 1-like [Daphnia pulicaria]
MSGFRLIVSIVFALVTVSHCHKWPPKTKVLHIGGIFPINGTEGWQGGMACQPSAMMALDDVNSRFDLLPGYKLKLHWNDSECEPGLGALVMYDLLYKPPQKLMLLAGCSTVCTTVAEAAKMWNLVVLSYGASSPALSNRQRFPTLFRTHPSATVHNPTRVKILQNFGWSRIAILQQAEEVFISTVEDLETRCRESGIEIVTRQSFLNDPSESVRNLRRQDARIIVGLFYVVAARRVLCEMYKQGLYGSSYVWFFIGWYEDNWYEANLSQEKIECTREQMKEAAEGHLTTEALNWNQDNQKTISGMTVEDYRKRLNNELLKNGHDVNIRFPDGYQEAPLAYDAVWAVALALNRTMHRLAERGRSLDDFTYNDAISAGEIYSAMNATQFLGVSGTVAFSSKGDRIAWTLIEQMINGQYNKVGYYDTQTDNLTWLAEARWINGKIPQDRTIIIDKLRTVSFGLFVTMSLVSSVGIAAAIGLIIFNVVYREQKLIELSQPACNNVMLVGIVLLLSSVILLGMDGDTVPVVHFPVVCQLRAWLLCLGFTLAFGAMFSKVWRVHRQSTKSKEETSKMKEKKSRTQSAKAKVDWVLVGLSCIDVIILTIWAIVDPQMRMVENFQLENPSDTEKDIKIRPSMEHCESKHQNIWLGVVYGYKGLLLIFGLFLAYETRSMKVRSINDSRYVGMSIYNVVVLCLITAPVSLVISSQADASFAFVTAALAFCCFISMALIFLPKVVEVVRNPDRPGDGDDETDQTVSKEEEERYRKLQQENEQLQQLIASREHKLKLLNQRLLERNASANVNGVTANPAVVSPSNNASTNVSTPVMSGPARTTTIHLPPAKKNSEVRFSTSSMEMLPNKTRVGVGIMKVHCTETIVTDTAPSTATPTTLVFNEEVMDGVGDEDQEEYEERECATGVELIEKITDSPMFQRGSTRSPEESYL